MGAQPGEILSKYWFVLPYKCLSYLGSADKTRLTKHREMGRCNVSTRCEESINDLTISMNDSDIHKCVIAFNDFTPTPIEIGTELEDTSLIDIKAIGNKQFELLPCLLHTITYTAPNYRTAVM